jgi:hypothetical protein
VCGEVFTRSNLVLCRRCSAPHHRKCWSFNKGCATYACPSRTFVLPPVTVGDEIEFAHRGRPSMAAVAVLVPSFVILLMLAINILPTWAVGPALAVLIPGYVIGMLGATVAPLAMETRYLLDPEAGAIHRERWFGPSRVHQLRTWRTFGDVEELEVRSVKGLAQRGGNEVRETEVWLRAKNGDRILLDRSEATATRELLERAEAAADAMDTTLGLPREVEAPAALPPGLDKALAALPRGAPEHELAALPEEASGDET